jgi:hypothetical protein
LSTIFATVASRGANCYAHRRIETLQTSCGVRLLGVYGRIVLRIGKRQGMQARKKSPSRLDMRREVEAADAIEKSEADGAGTKKKKTAKKKTAKKTTTRRTKVKAPQRKRLVWAVFSGSMKEEARFPYDQRQDAEKKLEQLRAKATKKMYFIQPIKEPLPDAPAPAAAEKGKK